MQSQRFKMQCKTTKFTYHVEIITPFSLTNAVYLLLLHDKRLVFRFLGNNEIIISTFIYDKENQVT